MTLTCSRRRIFCVAIFRRCKWDSGPLFPFREVVYLDRITTERAIKDRLAAPLGEMDPRRYPGRPIITSQGGCIFVEAALYQEIGGHDERFRGRIATSGVVSRKSSRSDASRIVCSTSILPEQFATALAQSPRVNLVRCAIILRDGRKVFGYGTPMCCLRRESAMAIDMRRER